MQAQEQRYYSPEDYQELEIASEYRHEYIDGQIILITGGTPNHQLPITNHQLPITHYQFY